MTGENWRRGNLFNPSYGPVPIPQTYYIVGNVVRNPELFLCQHLLFFFVLFLLLAFIILFIGEGICISVADEIKSTI